jgi:hypothetical protein
MGWAPSTAEVTSLAAEVVCDQRTARKFLAGGSVVGPLHARLDRAATELGLTRAVSPGRYVPPERLIATEAGCSVQTARKFWLGKTVSPTIAARLEAAVVRLGLTRPRTEGKGNDDGHLDRGV